MVNRDTDTTGAPRVLAHRGYAARYPENTREALRGAVNAGARYLEFDVQLSADREPFLLHDADFRRTAGVDQSMFSLTANEVGQISVGEPDRFGDRFHGVRAPRLTEVVADLAGWPEVQAFVEIKRESIEQFGLDVVLNAVLPPLRPIVDRCVIISFEHDAVVGARRLLGCPIGWALRAWDEHSRAKATAMRPEFLFCNVTRLPPAPAPLWSGPWRWVVYEITDIAVARALAARGVLYIETMACAEMAAALQASPVQVADIVPAPDPGDADGTHERRDPSPALKRSDT